MQEKRRPGRPTLAEVEARKKAEAAAAQPAPVIPDLSGIILALTNKIAELEKKVQSVTKDEVPAGPPPKIRAARKHIMVFVRPDTAVRVEVPDDYTGPGLDGHPVMGYINHANSVLFR